MHREGTILTDFWYNVGGGDGFHTQNDPIDWRTVYGESQGGAMQRTNVETRESRSIQPNTQNVVNYRDFYPTPSPAPAAGGPAGHAVGVPLQLEHADLPLAAQSPHTLRGPATTSSVRTTAATTGRSSARISRRTTRAKLGPRQGGTMTPTGGMTVTIPAQKRTARSSRFPSRRSGRASSGSEPTTATCR